MVTRRVVQALLVAAAALLATACSLQRLVFSNAAIAYNNVTPVLAWLVDDYVELSDVQKGWVRERLTRAFAWHRAQELPEYRRFFDTALKRAEDGITVGEARESHRELRAFYNRLVDRMLPDVAELLLQLDAEQLAQLERRFADDNRKIVKESVQGTPEQRRAKRTTRWIDNIEEWIGTLDERQRELVAAHVAATTELTDERLGDRRYRQTEMVALARARPSQEEAIAQLRRLLIDTDKWRRPEYVQKLRERDQQLFELIASLSATLSAEQRAHLQKRVRGFMRDITDLTAST